MNRVLLLLVATAACSAGPRPVSVKGSASADVTGSVAVLFTRPAKGVTVVIDGRLMVDRAHTDSVLIENVSAGLTDVMIAAGSGPSRVERQVRIAVDPGQVTTIPLGAPEAGGGTPGWANAAFSVAALVLSTAITSWLF